MLVIFEVNITKKLSIELEGLSMLMTMSQLISIEKCLTKLMFTSTGGKICNPPPAKQLMNNRITLQLKVKKTLLRTVPGKSFMKYNTQKKSGRSSILHLKSKDIAD